MKKTLLAIAVASLTGFSGVGRASGIPTVDVAALAQNIVDMGNQIQQLEQALTQVEQGVMQIEEARNQVLEAKRAFDSLNGIRGLGSLLNSDLYNASRNYLPGDWQRTLELGGDISNGRYSSLAAIRDEVRRRGRVYQDRSELNIPEESTALAELNAQEVIVEKAGVDVETAALATAGRGEELKAYKNAINTLPDQKSTLDLQASMMAEGLMLQNELIEVTNRQNAVAQLQMQQDLQRKERNLRINHLPYDPSAANEASRVARRSE